MSVTDIKDRAPNSELIEKLENLLDKARAGEIRTMISVCGWSDDSVTSGWCVDPRTSKVRLIGEVTLMQHNMADAINLCHDDSYLMNSLYDD